MTHVQRRNSLASLSFAGHAGSVRECVRECVYVDSSIRATHTHLGKRLLLRRLSVVSCMSTSPTCDPHKQCTRHIYKRMYIQGHKKNAYKAHTHTETPTRTH